MTTTLNTEDATFEHANGYHITAQETECERCLAGDWPTQAELTRALMLERWLHAKGRAKAEYAEWRALDAELERIAAPFPGNLNGMNLNGLPV